MFCFSFLLPLSPLSWINLLFKTFLLIWASSSSQYPILWSGYELCPDLIAMFQEFSFSGLDGKNPYHHLREFEQMCSCYGFAVMTQDTLRWKLLPFSLVEEARQWYINNVESVNGSWSKLRDKFCHRFYPSPVSSLYERISFAFSQMRRKP